MKLFEKMTLGYEWETGIYNEAFHFASSSVLGEVISELREEIPGNRTGRDGMWRIGDMIFEIRSGVLKSFPELKSDIWRIYSTVKEITEKKNLHFYPTALLDIYGRPLGLHVHVGTITDPSQANALANYMSKYAPAIIALSANSPVKAFQHGQFKSYRIYNNADWCSVPRRIVHPDFVYFIWGDDICVKFHYKPTVEIRCADSPSFPNLLIELVALETLSMVGISEKVKNYRVAKKSYIDNMNNRFLAAKYGLQAEFTVNGKKTTPVKMIEELFELAKPVMPRFKCKLSDFKIIKRMLAKKQTQADFKKKIFELSGDVYSYSSEQVRIAKDPDAFVKYLKDANELPTMPAKEISEYILELIKDKITFSYLNEKINLPTNYLLEQLEKLIKQGKIKKKMIPERGFEYIKLK